MSLFVQILFVLSHHRHFNTITQTSYHKTNIVR